MYWKTTITDTSCFVRHLVFKDRVLSPVQAAEIGFLQIVHGVTLRDTMRSCEIRKTLYIL